MTVTDLPHNNFRHMCIKDGKGTKISDVSNENEHGK